MFLKNTQDNFEFEQPIAQYTYPNKLYNVQCTSTPYNICGEKSGSFLLGQYLNSLRLQTIDETKYSDEWIVENLYEPIKNNKFGYITLNDGMTKVCEEMTNYFPYLSSKDIVYFNSTDMLKRYIHRCNIAVVEMQANSAYMNTQNNTMNGKFDISTNGQCLTEDLTKGFICVGYDDNGFVLFNSLGESYGNSGFIRVSHDVFKLNFIKGVVLNNIF